MRSFRTGLALSLLLLAGCGTHDYNAVVTVTVGGSDAAAVAEVVGRRLTGLSGAAARAVRPQVSGLTIRCRVNLPADARVLVAPVVSSEGRFRLGPRDAPDDTWLSEADVVTAQAYPDAGAYYVSVTASPAASQRLLRATAASVGRTVELSLNGRPLAAAVISGAFGDRPVQIGPLSEAEAKVAAIVLPTGRLPGVVTSVSVDSVAR